MLRFILSVLSVFVACPGFTTAASDTKSDKALKFAYDQNAYISYSPKVNSLAEKFSVCVWVRKFQSGNTPIAFAYNGWELALGDSGYYNMLFSTQINLASKFPTDNTWYLYCSTWSLASRTFRVYVNGQQVGTRTTTSGRRLQTGGTLTLGNYGTNNGHHFGGMLFNFNMYSKELTATEVAALSSGGFCAEIPEQLEEYRVIKWEDILKLSRSGTVLDIDTRCAAFVELPITRKKLELAVREKSSLELSLNKTRTDLLEVQERFNSTQEELVGVQERFNSTHEELVGVRRELGATEGDLNETKSDLQETKLELRNLTESKCALKKGNLTKWDMFYSPEYYNKTFTHTLYQQLTSTWDSISNRLFGMTITDKVIELIKDLDDDQIDHCGELS
ncbi:uncharacterized protein LOC134813932 isoform X1 [Bolinopsis microptera]|uniref:uncharacterized protein LOC134813932 isoform X1 n=1 Tax=Bolinopsis microptera TaxID=2820187 RepID=UPI0030791B4F